MAQDIEIRDREKPPLDGAFVMAPNHHSEIDLPGRGGRDVEDGRLPRFLAKDSLFRVPVLGAALRATGMVPVARGNLASQALEQAKTVVEQRSGVIVYPEGTLTRDPDLWPMRGKSGAVRIALAGGIPVIRLRTGASSSSCRATASSGSGRRGAASRWSSATPWTCSIPANRATDRAAVEEGTNASWRPSHRCSSSCGARKHPGALTRPSTGRQRRGGMTPPRVTVLGAGSWGTTFGKILADGGARVTMWARRPEQAHEIDEAKRN